MRKFLNTPDDVVRESLTGLQAAHGDLLRHDAEHQIVVRVDAPVSGKVGLVSGGGSGHEPLHAGFVGRGMLDAACPGAVFTSPVPEQVHAATNAVDAGAGVVHIVKNYTGDVMNFRLAAEDAADDGIQVEVVVIDDDVAVQDSTYTAGRRGVGATVLAEKMAGAAAERGDDVDAVARVARRVNDQGRSFGVALSSCTPPSSGAPLFDLPDGEMEVGIGIHGEPGRRREPLAPARDIAQIMVEAILGDRPLSDGAPVLAFTNGMGGTPLLELYLLHGEIDRLLREGGLRVERMLVGNYITSLEMAGASLTLLELDDELTTLWDAPVHTAAMREHAEELTALDAAIGDGDHGTNMRRGFDAVEQAIGEERTPGAVLTRAGRTLVSTVGGASGPLWGTALRRAGRTLGDAPEADGAALADALDAALAGVRELGSAQPGEKTMVDALQPAAQTFRERVDAGDDAGAAAAGAARAARDGADATVEMQARKGRASYLGERSVGHRDPGAASTTLIVDALARTLAGG